MKIWPLPVAMILCLTLTGACQVMAQGTIRFEGAIVERGCNPDLAKPSRLVLTGCPAPGVTPTLNVRDIDPINAGAKVTLKQVADSRREARYVDQRFELVDGAGAPIRSGHYLFTMTLP